MGEKGGLGVVEALGGWGWTVWRASPIFSVPSIFARNPNAEAGKTLLSGERGREGGRQPVCQQLTRSA